MNSSFRKSKPRDRSTREGAEHEVGFPSLDQKNLDVAIVITLRHHHHRYDYHHHQYDYHHHRLGHKPGAHHRRLQEQLAVVAFPLEANVVKNANFRKLRHY